MRARKKNPRSISIRTRFEVFKRDMFTCRYCGAKPPGVVLHIEHVVPVSKGGTGDITNLVTACESCNAGKSDVLLTHIARGSDLFFDQFVPEFVDAVPAYFGPQPVVVRHNRKEEARVLGMVEDAFSLTLSTPDHTERMFDAGAQCESGNESDEYEYYEHLIAEAL